MAKSRVVDIVGVVLLITVLVVGVMFIPTPPTTPDPATSLDQLAAHALQIRPWQSDGYIDPKSNTHQSGLDRRLTLAAHRLGITLKASNHLPENAVGVYIDNIRTIGLPPVMSIDAFEEILAHELAHSLEPPHVEFRHGESEVFAMSVSYLIMQRAGCDSACELRYATYLALHKTSLPVMKVYRPEIEFAAQTIWGEQ